MAYNKNIPLSNDILSVSQGDLLANFTALNNFFEIDHVAFDAVSDNGKHIKTTFIEQSGDQSTSADEIVLYSKENPSKAGQTDLFLRKESNALPVINITDYTASTSAGEFTLPNGLIVKWENEVTLSGSGTTYTYAFPTPYSTALYSVIVTSANRTQAVALPYVEKSTLVKTGFTVKSDGSGGTRKINYVSIGI